MAIVVVAVAVPEEGADVTVAVQGGDALNVGLLDQVAEDLAVPREVQVEGRQDLRGDLPVSPVVARGRHLLRLAHFALHPEQSAAAEQQ